MKFSKNTLSDFGKTQALLETSVIAVNEKFQIEYINTHAKKMLCLKQNTSLLGTSIIALFEQLKIPLFFNIENANPELMLINNYFQKWQKIIAQIENKEWTLLVGQIVGKDDFFQKLRMPEESSASNNIIINLTKIIENLPEFVYWKDKDCVYQGCNQQVAKLLNLACPTEIVGKTDYDFGWSVERIKTLQAVDHSILQEGTNSVVEDLIPINGVNKIFLTSKTPLRDEMGKIAGVLGISIDITERKKMEEELRKIRTTTAELERLDNIIKYAPDIIYWKDKDSVYLGGNNQLAIAAGLPNREAIIGKSDYDFPWYKQAWKYHLDDKEVIESGVPKLNIEDISLLEDGKELTVITNKVPLRNSNNEVIGVLGIATDITDRKKMEKDLEKAKNAAEAANQAKSEFIANMSHDIRTPLTGVIGMAKMLEDNVENEHNKQIAHFLEESGNQLLIMLNDILDVASSEHIDDVVVQETSFDLRQTIQNVIELEKPSVLLKGLRLMSDVDQTIPPYLVGDATKIHRIILNLVGNAIKFTKTGSVILDLKCLEKKEGSVSIQVSVIDTGVGIPLEFQDKVFEKFTRGTPSHNSFYKGHGLGLHIVQSYVQALGGRIKFTSEVDKGTTFFVDLTLKIGESVCEPLDMQQGAISTSSSEMSLPTSKLVKSVSCNEVPADAPHILLVEDNQIALISVENIVRKAGCRSTSAVDGESALYLAKIQPFDLIITDLGLPGISGMEFVQSLRVFEKQQQKQAIPIVGLTAHAEGTLKEACLQAGMNEVVSKPMASETMERIKTTYLALSNKLKPGLGIDLPDTEEELFMLEKFPLFDLESALNGVGNDCNLLKTLLTSMINEETPKDKCAIEKAYAEGDWDSVEKLAHRMKGGFVYCGTTRLVFAAQYLERYRKAGHNQSFEPLYKQFLAVIDETIPIIGKWLAKN